MEAGEKEIRAPRFVEILVGTFAGFLGVCFLALGLIGILAE